MSHAVRVALFMVGMSLGACQRQPSTIEVQPEHGVVRVLLVNDVYVTDTLRNGRGGLARVVALRDSIEAGTRAPVLFVLAGDVLSPSVLGKWYHGAQMVEGFNLARLDYAALGNHEFDLTREQLLARIAESRFRWMSGNCGDATTGTPFPGVRGWDTVRVKGALVGLFSTTIVMNYSAYVRCTDADVATTALIDTLQHVGADLILGLTHRGIHADSATLVAEQRLHAIVGGHEHDGRRIAIDGRLLVKAQSNARTAVLVTFRRSGNAWSVTDTAFQITRGMPENRALVASVKRWNDSLVTRVGPERIVGYSREPIDAGDSTSRRGESRFGNLVADGLRLGTLADVALINSGALRFDDVIPVGPITTHMLEAIFLFADETRVVTFPLTGSRLREILEHSVARGSLGSGPYLQVSGVRFAFDARRPSGSRLVGDLFRSDASVIQPADTLQIAFVVYPACRSGDGYRIPEAASACERVARAPASAPRSVDLLRAHLKQMNGDIVLPPLGRVHRVDAR